jgi:hypothetical protein
VLRSVDPGLREVAAVVAELGGVRAGDIRDRRARPPVVELPLLRRAADPSDHGPDGTPMSVKFVPLRTGHGIRTNGRSEFDHPRNVRIGVK